MKLLNEIEVYMDEVIIEGVTIPRPDRIPRSDWILFWSEVADLNEDQ